METIQNYQVEHIFHDLGIQVDEQPAPALTYDPDELARIVEVIRQATDPEHIILFGSLAGATPFSDIAAYDLLIVSAHCSPEDWAKVHSHINFKIPTRSRAITFINFHLCTLSATDGPLTSFSRFVRAEGKVVFSRRKFRWKPCDYERMYFAALSRYELYFGQAGGFLDAAGQSLNVCDYRQTVFHTAYAAELLLHALYAAYYASDPAVHAVTTLLLRMRTLSAELFMLLDPEKSCGSRMLSRLDYYRKNAPYLLKLETDRDEIGEYFERTGKMKGIVERLCLERLDLYKSRIPVDE